MSTLYLHGIEEEYKQRGLPAWRAKSAARRYERIYAPSKNGEKIKRFFLDLFKE